MTDTTTPPDAGAISRLRDRLARGKQLIRVTELAYGPVRMWTASVRGPLREIFGPESPIFSDWPQASGPTPQGDARAILASRISRLETLVGAFHECEQSGGAAGTTIFIGHGRSLVWHELKDFLCERLGLPWEEFNRQSTAGIATTDRLVHMLHAARFAFLIMTAEDEHADASIHARENVVHEVGLFQGKLGLRKAIILLEEGCATFSNIHGLTYIGFPRGRLAVAFEDIRRVLEREQIVGA
jgi:hypothetical protein